MGIEIGIAIIAMISILSLGIGVPFLIYITETKLWYPNILRPKKKISIFPGVRFSGRFSEKEVNIGFRVFRNLWIKHVGGSEEFSTMFNYLDILFLDKIIVQSSMGKENLYNGILDSGHLIRIFDKSCILLKDKNGNFYKKGRNYACKPRDPEDIKISDTALGHELIHAALGATTGQPDSDHLGNRHTTWKKVHSKIDSEWRRIMREKGL